MVESIKAQLADVWQAIIDWDPHWLVQGVVVVVLVWIFTVAARWIGKKLVESAKRNYAEMVEIQEKQEAERQKDVRWIGLKVRSLEHGGIAAIAGLIQSSTSSLLLFLFSMTTVILMAIDYNSLATITKIIGWAFFIAAFIQATFHIKYAATIFEGIEEVEDQQLEEMIKDDDKRKELLDL